ncbi:hypothetical protein ACFLYO_03970 [Chloroflexota bacterium]
MAYRSPGQSGPPAWLVILAAAMLVFGGYFIWSGVRNYMAGAFETFTVPTEIASVNSTPGLSPSPDDRFTPLPSRTPLPDCQDFLVIVPEAIVRECASTNCAIADTRHEGDTICVLQRDQSNEEWYIVDLDDSRFFTTLAYMHESLLRSLSPTATPSSTSRPLPTLTPVPTDTALPTLQPAETSPTVTPEATVPPSATPTTTPSATPPLISG